jgi:hypothetical protein
MRNIQDLTHNDFPDVDFEKFEVWKTLHAEALKKQKYFNIVYSIILGIGLIILLGNKIFLGIIPLLILFGARAFISSSILNTSSEFRRELGISDEALKQSLKKKNIFPVSNKGIVCNNCGVEISLDANEISNKKFICPECSAENVISEE